MSRKLGVALGAGGSWGFASLGVLRALEEEGIKVDYLSGSSMGSIIAVAYASKFAGEDTINQIINIFKTIKLRHIVKLSTHPFGLSSHEKRQVYFEKLLKDLTFEKLTIPVGVVATDFKTGEEVLFKEGPVLPATLASSALPFIFAPYNYQGAVLIDGGLSNPTPVDVVRNMGAEIVIGVDVTSKQHLTRLQTQTKWHHKVTLKIPVLRYFISTKFDKIYFQVLDLLFSNLNKGKVLQSPPDFLLTPEVTHLGQMDFKKINQIEQEGYKETKKIIPALKKLLDPIKSDLAS